MRSAVFAIAAGVAACLAPANWAADEPGVPRFHTGIGLAELPRSGSDSTTGEAQRLGQLAAVEFNTGDFAAARRHFESALTLAPGNPSILTNLSILDYREHKYAEAERYLKAVLRAEPESPLPWLLLGVVSYDQEKLDEALAALAQAEQ